MKFPPTTHSHLFRTARVRKRLLYISLLMLMLLTTGARLYQPPHADLANP